MPVPFPEPTSHLPRSGRVRAARLLAEIGDAHGRFPTAESMACLGSVTPSTRQPGTTAPRRARPRPRLGPSRHHLA